MSDCEPLLFSVARIGLLHAYSGLCPQERGNSPPSDMHKHLIHISSFTWHGLHLSEASRERVNKHPLSCPYFCGL